MTARKYSTEMLPKLFEESGRSSEYELVDCSNVYGNKSKIIVKHRDCGHTFDVAIQHFFNTKTNCAKCSNHIPVYTQENFLNVWFSVERHIDYELLDFSNVRDSKSKFTVKHKICGYIFDVDCDAFFRGGRFCKKCSDCIPKYTQENFLNVWRNSGRYEDYELLDYSHVKNKDTKFTVKHRLCGYTFNVACHSFFYAEQGCPRCKSSKGEIKIYNFLVKNNLIFTHQHTIDGCIKIKLLKFDFFVLHHNLLIEYHGVQHYKCINYFGGESQFRRQKEYDMYKRQFALQHKYVFLEIPYWEYKNIEQILTDKLNS